VGSLRACTEHLINEHLEGLPYRLLEHDGVGSVAFLHTLHVLVQCEDSGDRVGGGMGCAPDTGWGSWGEGRVVRRGIYLSEEGIGGAWPKVSCNGEKHREVLHQSQSFPQPRQGHIWKKQ